MGKDVPVRAHDQSLGNEVPGASELARSSAHECRRRWVCGSAAELRRLCGLLMGDVDRHSHQDARSPRHHLRRPICEH